MSTGERKSHFGGYLILLIACLLLQGSSFLSVLYFLAENLKNNGHWLYFSLTVLANLALLVALHFLNRHLSVGRLGSEMQKFRSSRFTAAFLSVAFSTLLAMAVVLAIDRFFPGTSGPTNFGSLAALLVSMGGVVDFVYVYCLLQGQGLSRL